VIPLAEGAFRKGWQTGSSPDHPRRSGHRSYIYGDQGTLWVRDYIITSERYKPLGFMSLIRVNEV